jgi:hypothetical protein
MTEQVLDPGASTHKFTDGMFFDAFEKDGKTRDAVIIEGLVE